MRRKRTIYFNDARHYYLFVFEPPMRLQDAWQPIDEVAGTAVDTFAYGVARTDGPKTKKKCALYREPVMKLESPVTSEDPSPHGVYPFTTTHTPNLSPQKFQYFHLFHLRLKLFWVLFSLDKHFLCP